jgi:hypothetical protein
MPERKVVAVGKWHFRLLQLPYVHSLAAAANSLS